MNPRNRKRAIECILVLEDAIVMASLSNYPDVEALKKTRTYIMEKGSITSEMISEYSVYENLLEKRAEFVKTLCEIDAADGKPFFNVDFVKEKILGIKKDEL